VRRGRVEIAGEEGEQRAQDCGLHPVELTQDFFFGEGEFEGREFDIDDAGREVTGFLFFAGGEDEGADEDALKRGVKGRDAAREA